MHPFIRREKKRESARDEDRVLISNVLYATGYLLCMWVDVTGKERIISIMLLCIQHTNTFTHPIAVVYVYIQTNEQIALNIQVYISAQFNHHSHTHILSILA